MVNDPTKNTPQDTPEVVGNRAAKRAALRAPKEDTTLKKSKLTPRLIEEDDEPYEAPPFSMSGIRNSVSSGVWKFVLMLLIFIFAVGSFLVGGGPTEVPPGATINPTAPVATVAGRTISRQELDSALAQQVEMSSYFGQTPTAADWFQTKQSALQGLSRNAAVIKAAQDANVAVTDDEINARIDKEINDSITQQSNGNMANFRRQIEATGKTEASLREELRTQYDRDRVRDVLLAEKYEKQWKETNKVTEADYLKSVTQLDLNQIVIRSRPPLPTDTNAQATVQKNKVEAQNRAQKLADELKKLSGPALKARFVQLAKTQSDDAATKAKGGALGFKLPAELPVAPSTREAIAAVKSVPAVVGPFQDDTVGGSVLLLVNAKRPQLPKDYTKNKTNLVKTFEEQRDTEAWNTYAETLAKAATPELQDPGLQAYKAQVDGSLAMLVNNNNAARNDALAKYEQALPSARGLEAAAIRYQMAQLYGAMKQPEKQITALRAAISDVPSSAVNIRLELARVLRETKKNAEAVKELQAASKELDDAPPAQSPFGGNPNDMMRTQIASQFAALGRSDLATAERGKIQPAAGAPGAAAGAPGIFTVPGGTTR